MHEGVSKIRRLMKEHHRKRGESIDLIPATNLLSNMTREIIATDACRRITELKNGRPFFAGTTYLDQALETVHQLVRTLFKADFVSLRPVTGNLALLSAFLGLLPNGGRLMSPEWGGYGLATRMAKDGVRDVRTEFLSINREDTTMDLDRSIETIQKFKPNVIMLGASYFLFPHPVKAICKAASEVGAHVVYDGAHVLGLIAGGVFQDPFGEGCPLLVASTNKTFPGPHRGVIMGSGDETLFKRATASVEPPPLLESTYDVGTTIALGIACAEMLEFGRDYAQQVVRNARALGRSLYSEGIQNLLASDKGFTESHMVIQKVGDITSAGAEEVQSRLAGANVFVDFGVRYATNEVTRRGMKEGEMKEIGEIIGSVLVKGTQPQKAAREVAELSRRFPGVSYSFDSEEEAYEYFEMSAPGSR